MSRLVTFDISGTRTFFSSSDGKACDYVLATGDVALYNSDRELIKTTNKATCFVKRFNSWWVQGLAADFHMPCEFDDMAEVVPELLHSQSHKSLIDCLNMSLADATNEAGSEELKESVFGERVLDMREVDSESQV